MGYKIKYFRVGQNRIYTPYMTVYLMISLPKIPYIHRIYMVLANPRYLLGYTFLCFVEEAAPTAEQGSQR